MTKDELIAYVQKDYNAEPEYLWQAYPNAFILRHQSNRKWFAVAMDVQRSKLHLRGEGVVFVVDFKCGPLLGGSYLGKPGVLPAYHMNHAQWLTILLDGTVPLETVCNLLDISYQLRMKKKMRKGALG